MKTAFDYDSQRPLGLNGRARALAALLSLLAVSGAASAQWSVIDNAHITTQKGEFVETASRWIDQGKQWEKEYKEWKQQYDSMLSQLSNIQSSMGIAGDELNMDTIALDTNVQERCGAQYGTGVAGILGKITKINMTDDPYQVRWEICRNTQVARNMQYNEMVTYMKRDMPRQRNEFVNLFNKYRNRNLTSGETSAAGKEIDATAQLSDQERTAYEQRQRGYDTYIEQQNKNLQTLTQTALRGTPGLIQQITTTEIMRIKLCGADNSRCNFDERAAVGRH